MKTSAEKTAAVAAKNGVVKVVKEATHIPKCKTRFLCYKDSTICDLKPTFDRIGTGTKFPHRNDGAVFKNFEKLLPANESGYYREFVHAIPGSKGPGPMRIVVGKHGETWFTTDHYKTFIKIQ